MIKNEVTRVIFNVQIQSPEELEQASEQIEEGLSRTENLQFKHEELGEGGEPLEDGQPALGDCRQGRGSGAPASRRWSRNDPCPCGSGKKA